MVARWSKLRHDFASIGDQEALATPDLADVFAQAVLEFTQPNGLHAFNVASWRYIVKPRLVLAPAS